MSSNSGTRAEHRVKIAAIQLKNRQQAGVFLCHRPRLPLGLLLIMR